MEQRNDLKERLDKLVAERDDYICSERESLKEKCVIPLFGASAVGKSTIIASVLHHAGEMGLDAAEAGTSATRAARPGDPPNYHTDRPIEEMIEKIERGEPVNWSLMPTGEIYATMPEDFPAEYSFMACMSDSLPMLQRAGFKAVHAFYIVTSPDAWEKQLQLRMYTPETLHLPEDQRTIKTDFSGRLDDAMKSLPFGLNADKISRIVSLPGEEELQKTAHKILEWSTRTEYPLWGYTRTETFTDQNFESYCRDMFRLALDLAREVETAA
jgi:hypothetical protein